MRPEARRRFARQLSLAEVGEGGQARLCAHVVRVEGDPRAAEVAALYLARAGVQVSSVGARAPEELPLPLAGGGRGEGRAEPQTLRASPTPALPRERRRELPARGGSEGERPTLERLTPSGPPPAWPEPRVLYAGSHDHVVALAGAPELEEAAAFALGAFAAVEEIKRALGVGRAGSLDGVSLIAASEDA